MEENELHANIILRSATHAAWFQQRIAKHAWENWSPTAIAPERHDRERQGGKRNVSALRAASEHCVASRATFACAKIQTTDGWESGIPSFVSCMSYVVCCCYHACRVPCALCAREPACCVVCVSCMSCVRCHVCCEHCDCVVTGVVHVASALSSLSYMSCAISPCRGQRADDIPQNRKTCHSILQKHRKQIIQHSKTPKIPSNTAKEHLQYCFRRTEKTRQTRRYHENNATHAAHRLQNQPQQTTNKRNHTSKKPQHTTTNRKQTTPYWYVVVFFNCLTTCAPQTPML